MQTIKLYFTEEIDFYKYVILQCLTKTDKPLGSWVLKERLSHMEVNLSLASIGRYLKVLDYEGLTKLVQSQGRKITSSGLNYLNKLEGDIKRKQIGSEMEQAANPESKQDIIDLLHVRKIIEVEVVKSIINHGASGVTKLENSVESHLQCVKKGDDPDLLAINFHQILSDMSCNRFLKSVLNLLINEEMMLEEKFPEFAEKLRDAHHIVDHECILKAIKEQNLEEAIYYTENHIENLIKSVK